MADVEQLLDGVPVRLAPAQAVRARGERRRARQKGGLVAVAVLAAAAVGVSSWTQPAPGPPPTGLSPAGTSVAPDGENPFKPHGVVQNLKPSDLPKDAVLHWQLDSGDSEVVALPQAGLHGACNGWPGGITAPEQQFTSAFTGRGDARARYRVSQYATEDQALDAVRALGQALHDCGLQEHQDGSSYSGETNAGPRLEVSVRRWGAWVGVVEAQYRPTA
ncbi:hypothetical protein [Krasilnikovia sp. M28-CT-15]|uniref:hypothetical protein n=1 Tax=Krasilnikovia sp. M28-CT-15 TaxID=3373540 RepID=UPI003876F3D5